jgi:hypothetical protein
MKDIIEIRRDNLRFQFELFKQERHYQRGVTQEFLDLLGWSKQLLSAYIGTNPRSGIGHEIARQVEERLGLPMNWMDNDHNVKRSDNQLVDEIATLARQLTEEERKNLVTLLQASLKLRNVYSGDKTTTTTGEDNASKAIRRLPRK